MRSRCSGDLRSDVGVRSRGSPWRSVCPGVVTVDELVVDRSLDEQAGAGEADLPGIVVLADHGLDRRVEVGVGEHEKRRLAAEEPSDRGVRFGAAAWRWPAPSVRSR